MTEMLSKIGNAGVLPNGEEDDPEEKIMQHNVENECIRQRVAGE